jgi:glycoprotein endo-alpha-1,2-mannosidase
MDRTPLVIGLILLATAMISGHEAAGDSVEPPAGLVSGWRDDGNASPGGEIDYYVGVHYYPWYYDDFHGGRYLREHLIPAQLPELGEYNDREAAVIGQHLSWCRDSGIDFWSASWWGPGSREDVTLLNHIFQHPDLGDFKIAILYETVGRTKNFTDYSMLAPDITYLAANYFPHDSYLKIDGKPVVIVYLTRVLSSRRTLHQSLDAMREAAGNAGYQLYIVGDQVFGSSLSSRADIDALDAIINYDVYGSMGATGYAGQAKVDAYYAAQARWKALADSVGTDYAPAVTPGFNDKAVRAGHSPVSRKLTRDDEFGSLFRAMLRGAKALTDPDLGHMVLITSWNEWHEDTQIEPVEEAPPTSTDDSATGTAFTDGLAYEGYASRYLDILREELPFALAADIDIDPFGSDDRVQLGSHQRISVVILGSDTFDVSEVDVASLACGPDGAPSVWPPPEVATPAGFRDWNDDGLVDLLVHFDVAQTGISVGDTEACLSGELLDGTPFEGCDAVEVFAPRGMQP